MAENNAYKLKLFQDETARGLARLYEAGYLPNDHMGEVSLRDAESGLVLSRSSQAHFTSQIHRSTTAAISPSPPWTGSRSPP